MPADKKIDPRKEVSKRVINEVIEALELENPKQLADSLGFKRPENIYKITRGEVKISNNMAITINKKYPQFSINYLLTGNLEGTEKSVQSENKSVTPEEITVNEPLEYFNTKAGSQYEELPGGRYKLTVPFVPVKAQATYVMEHTDAEFISSLETVTFIVDRVGNGKYVAFEIQNDSMNDGTINSIPDGTIVLARELGRQHWKSKFRTREYPHWIIVHKSTVLCKEIINQEIENGIITCHSLNGSPEFQDFQVSLNDVKQLFNIIKRQLP